MLNKYQTGEGQRLELDSIMSRLLENNASKAAFTENEIKEVLNAVKYILIEQPMMLELQSPVKIVGTS